MQTLAKPQHEIFTKINVFLYPRKFVRMKINEPQYIALNNQ